MNISELEQLLKSFYRISGMEIALIDNKFHTILSVTHPLNHFCHMIHRYPECTDICRESDDFHLKLLWKKESIISYTCPFGLFTILAPIKIENEIIAFLVMAPAIEIKNGCDDIPYTKAKSMLPSINSTICKQSIKNIPHYSRETLDAYAEILLLIANTIEQQNLMLNTERSIAELTKNYIDQNLNRKITLRDISWDLHYSTVTITEHFKKKYGISIMQYVMNERMKLAEKLLKEGTDTVTSVAQACGFSDVEYFSRTFKKHHGVPPSQWT